MEFKLNDYHRNISDEELINDLRSVAKQLGKDSITIEDYKHGGGKYSRDTISRRFGGWIAALQKSGLSVTSSQLNRQGIDKNNMIEDLKYVAGKLCKKTFTTTEYSKYGKFSKDHYSQKFGSWNNALESAGLEPFDHPLGGAKNKVSQYACLEEIQRLWIELGRQPTTTDIKNGRSRYSLHIFERRFGSWRKALEFFVEYMNGDVQVQKPVELDDVKNESNQTQTSLSTNIAHKTKRDINLKMRFLVMKRDNFKCCLCGRSPATTPGLELHIDHIKPWSKGGETTIDNLQTLCSDCNLGKSNL